MSDAIGIPSAVSEPKRRAGLNDRKSNRERTSVKAPASSIGMVTDRHDGERLAEAAITTADAGACR